MNNPDRRIDIIRLKGVCPSVFETVPSSGIWGKSVEFVRGENYLVKAESGTGKSSLCSFLYGSRRVPEYRGSIFFDNEDIAGFSKNRFTEIRRRNLAYLPQDMLLFGELTAMENIHLKNSLTKCLSTGEIMEMMARLEIDSFADRKVSTLSIGQQQRVAVVRALCQPYDFLLLDEPVSHLDSRNNALVASLVSADAASKGASIIATSVGADLLLEEPFKTISL